jgi:trehalose/maltose transport system substrate-binding protein
LTRDRVSSETSGNPFKARLTVVWERPNRSESSRNFMILQLVTMSKRFQEIWMALRRERRSDAAAHFGSQINCDFALQQAILLTWTTIRIMTSYPKRFKKTCASREQGVWAIVNWEDDTMKKYFLAAAAACAMLATNAALAANISIVSGSTGNDLAIFQELVKPWEAKTGNTVTVVPMPSSTTDQFGQYRLWLAAGNSDIDVYQVDVIWAPQLAEQFVDLTEAAKDIAPLHFPSIIESQTVNGKLVAIPLFTDAPALYYRKDLLEKHGKAVPKTWKEMGETAKFIQDAERAAGNKDIQGFVFQGNAYEGLTCNALEWLKSNGGGQVVEADGSISVNNEKAASALEAIKGFVGVVSPEGVLAYQEEEARGVWQTGNAVFMRNWPYAYGLGNGDDSKVKGLFDVTTLPTGEGEGAGSAATLGGWNIAVSKYSKNLDAAVDLAKYLGSVEYQKANAIKGSKLPTIVSLYDDAEIKAAQPIIPRWKEVFLNAVPRPSAPTKVKYNEVSSLFWSAVHDTLSGKGTAKENLETLEAKLTELKGDAW